MRILGAILLSSGVLATSSVPVASAVDGFGPHSPGPETPVVNSQVPAGMSTAIRIELAVRHRRVAPTGVPIGLQRPDVSMRYERLRREGTWVTVVTRLGESTVPVRGLAGPEALVNPFRVARVELVDGEMQPRMFDAAGRPVRGLSPGDLAIVRATAPAVDDQGRTEGAIPRLVIPQVETADARRAALVARYGPPTVGSGGYERYIATSAGGRSEVLVDPASALPTEILTTLDGGGHMRTGITYAAWSRSAHVRRLLRSEYHLPGDAGRAITEVEVTAVDWADEAQP